MRLQRASSYFPKLHFATQDVVPKAPKFFIMYKRAGYRVIINHNGDMIVRPSAIEASVQVAGAPCAPICHSLLKDAPCVISLLLLRTFWLTIWKQSQRQLCKVRTTNAIAFYLSAETSC